MTTTSKQKIRIDRIRKQAAKTIKDIRRIEAKLARPAPDPLEAFRQGLKNGLEQPKKIPVDKQNRGAKTTGMSLSQSNIARIYSLSRQRISYMLTREKLPLEILLNPDLLFEKRLQYRRSNLRTKLADPAIRKALAERLSSLSSNT